MTEDNNSNSCPSGKIPPYRSYKCGSGSSVYSNMVTWIAVGYDKNLNTIYEQSQPCNPYKFLVNIFGSQHGLIITPLN